MSDTTHSEQTPTHHQVVANGAVIYEGEDWQQPFLEAGMNPEFGEVLHVRDDGETGATIGPPLYKQIPL
jgi:hypothetical protein